MLLIADVVTKESIGAAGMMGAVLGLIAIIKMLIVQRQQKNGSAVASKKYVREMFVEFKNPSEQEKIQRDLTRERILKISLCTEAEEITRKESEKIAAETLRRMREIADALRRIEKSTGESLKLALVDEKQNAILDEIRQVRKSMDN